MGIVGIPAMAPGDGVSSRASGHITLTIKAGRPYHCFVFQLVILLGGSFCFSPRKKIGIAIHHFPACPTIHAPWLSSRYIPISVETRRVFRPFQHNLGGLAYQQLVLAAYAHWPLVVKDRSSQNVRSTSTSNRFAHEDLADWVYPGKYLPFYPLFSNFLKGNIGIYPTMLHDQVSLYLNSIGEYMNIGRIWMNSGYFLWTRGRDRAIWRPSSSSFLKIPYRRASPRMEMAEWFPLVFLASFITPKQVSWVGFEHFCGIQHRHLTWIHLCLDPTVNTSDIPVRGKAVGCIFQHSDFLCGYISAYFSMRIVCWYCCSFCRCRPKFDYYYTSYIINIYIYIDIYFTYCFGLFLC